MDRRRLLFALALALLWTASACSAPAPLDADTFGANAHWEPHVSGDVPPPPPLPDVTVPPISTPDIVVGPTADASAAEIAPWDVSSPETGLGPCSCDGPTHCDEAGQCAPDICEKGVTTCATIDLMQHCAQNGGSFEVESCFTGQVCWGGVCVDPICTPSSLGGCQGTDWLACNALGTEWVAYPCPLDAPCQSGECRPVEPNVLMVIDTSGSMNWTPDGDQVSTCLDADCEATWFFPTCDNPLTPITRLGKVKAALTTVVQSESAQTVRLALQRFPQRPFEPGGGGAFGGGGEPACEGGYWNGTDEAMITGDDGSHHTTLDGWFGTGLGEVIIVPFKDETQIDFIAQWFDFVEEAVQTETICEFADVCAGGPCVYAHCLTTTNPELRGSGPTPLGKSLFYAGEYLHHHVLIEGKACTTNVDCPSPHHDCTDGVCHDAFGHCRDHIIILFTDGDDTRNVPTADFFNPRVQAKRLHFGLGCESDEQCLAGATCGEGICRAPVGTVIDPNQLVCDAGETPCSSDGECDDPCANWGGCAGACAPTEPLLTSSEGADHITDQAGNPISIRVHVVDASGVDGSNSLIAAYGGGLHFSVDLDNPGELVASIYELIGDTKDTTPCAAE
ncbi:MAG: hypothetical protein QF464_05170 [Myxococcota bacterium]|nr:hypothetical protein [Myxococcota bacterium]